MTNLTGTKTLDNRDWSVNDPDVFVSNIRGSKVRYRRKSTGAYLSGWIYPLGPLPQSLAKTPLGRAGQRLTRISRSMAYVGEQAAKSLAPLAEAIERMKPQYDSMTRDELRALCKERGLSGYGNLRKSELVNMLTEDDKADA